MKEEVSLIKIVDRLNEIEQQGELLTLAQKEEAKIFLATFFIDNPIYLGFHIPTLDFSQGGQLYTGERIHTQDGDSYGTEFGNLPRLTFSSWLSIGSGAHHECGRFPAGEQMLCQGLLCHGRMCLCSFNFLALPSGFGLVGSGTTPEKLFTHIKGKQRWLWGLETFSFLLHVICPAGNTTSGSQRRTCLCAASLPFTFAKFSDWRTIPLKKKDGA